MSVLERECIVQMDREVLVANLIERSEGVDFGTVQLLPGGWRASQRLGRSSSSFESSESGRYASESFRACAITIELLA